MFVSGLKGLSIEIGPNHFYIPSDCQITRSIDVRGKASKVTLELEANEDLIPTNGPWIVCITTGNGIKKFGGELWADTITYTDNQNTKKLDLAIEGFLSLATRKKIRNFNMTNTPDQIIGQLIEEGGAGGSKPLLAADVRGYTSKDIVNFIIKDQDNKYLYECLDMLAAQLGATWNLTDGDWESVSKLATFAGPISTIIFQNSSVMVRPAGKRILRKLQPTDPIREDLVFYKGDPKIDKIDPRFNTVIVYGRNGELAKSDDQENAIIASIGFDIPMQPIQLAYQYPDTATDLIMAVLKSKPPINNLPSPCSTISFMNPVSTGDVQVSAQIFSISDDDTRYNSTDPNYLKNFSQTGTFSIAIDLTDPSVMGVTTLELMVTGTASAIVLDEQSNIDNYLDVALFTITVVMDINGSVSVINDVFNVKKEDLVSARFEHDYNLTVDLKQFIGTMPMVTGQLSILINAFLQDPNQLDPMNFAPGTIPASGGSSLQVSINCS